MLWLKRSMPILHPNKAIFTDLPPLSERLRTVLDMLPRGGVICDIGSDHGVLPLYALKNEIVSFAIVTDLNQKPLQRAEKQLTSLGFADRSEFLLIDGIPDTVDPSPDAYVIAGMGGETIAGILERAEERIAPHTFFVLQPMTKIEKLRAFLYHHGFSVKDERVVWENDKFFLVLSAEYIGVAQACDDMTLFLGEFLSQNKDETTLLYFKHLLASLEKIIQKKKCAAVDASQEIKKYEALHHLLEEKL